MECCELSWDDIFRAIVQFGAVQTKQKAQKFIIRGIPPKDFDNLRNGLRLQNVKFDINGRRVIVTGDATFSLMYARSGDLVTLDFAQKRMRAQVVENRMRP